MICATCHKYVILCRHEWASFWNISMVRKTSLMPMFSQQSQVMYPSYVASGQGLVIVNRYRFIFERFRANRYFFGVLYLVRTDHFSISSVKFDAQNGSPTTSLWQEHPVVTDSCGLCELPLSSSDFAGCGHALGDDYPNALLALENESGQHHRHGLFRRRGAFPGHRRTHLVLWNGKGSASLCHVYLLELLCLGTKKNIYIKWRNKSENSSCQCRVQIFHLFFGF